MTELPEQPVTPEPVLTDRWGFAAAANTVEEVPTQVDGAKTVALAKQYILSEESQAQVNAAAKAVVELIQTGLWGSGPFTVSVAGNRNSVYLSVTGAEAAE